MLFAGRRKIELWIKSAAFILRRAEWDVSFQSRTLEEEGKSCKRDWRFVFFVFFPFHLEVTTMTPCLVPSPECPEAQWITAEQHQGQAREKEVSAVALYFTPSFPVSVISESTMRLPVGGSCLVLVWTPFGKWEHITRVVQCGMIETTAGWVVMHLLGRESSVSRSGLVVHPFILFYIKWK